MTNKDDAVDKWEGILKGDLGAVERPRRKPLNLDDVRELLTAGQPPTTITPKVETTVITVRLPKPLHEALKLLAHEQNLSLNQLCVEALWRAAYEHVNDLATEMRELGDA